MVPPILAAQFLSSLVVQQLDDAGGTWEVRAPLRFQSAVMRARLVVPEGFVTDFASTPRLPIAYLLAGGVAQAPATVHDFLYQTHVCKTRAEADAVFAEAMRVVGVPAWRRGPMWLAVRVAGRRAWKSGPTRYTVLGNHHAARDLHLAVKAWET